MTLRVLHSSDLHGHYKRLLMQHAETEFDVWLDTGDFFPNAGRTKGVGGAIAGFVEGPYQRRWLSYKNLPSRFAAWLRGRPALVVSGNHDFIDLAAALRQAGVAAQAVPASGALFVGGAWWAGFREVPFMAGEWQGEVEEQRFHELVDVVLQGAPRILATHAPPQGILNPDPSSGVAPLAAALRTRAHTVKAHFFGHDHDGGGTSTVQHGVCFFNGATHARVHVLELP